MKILMFGRGVIATQYGWAFEKAGHEIEFYVRPGRSAEYGPVVHLNLLDGRKNSKGDKVLVDWPVTMKESPDKEHGYDIIVISVNHNQLESAAKLVGSLAGNATVLIFNNLWDNPNKIEAYFTKEQVLWGFPGAGGGFKDINTLNGGFMKTVFLQTENTAPSAKRYKQVAMLFRSAGFSFMRQKNMRNWLWGHFISNTAMSAVAMKAGGHGAVFQSDENIKEAICLIKEMVPLIKARGGNPDLLTSLLTRLPLGLTSVLMRKTSAEGSLTGEILRRMDEAGHVKPEMNCAYIEPVIDDARRLGVELPRLVALRQYWEQGAV